MSINRAATGEPVDPRKWIWGVDVSVKNIALGLTDGEDATVTSKDFPKNLGKGGKRLHVIFQEVTKIGAVYVHTHPPLRIYVEQPSGKFADLQLVYATGVFQAALAPYGPVLTVPSSRWKLHAVGSGKATPQRVASWAKQRVPELSSQDECCSLGIAVGGWRMEYLAQRKAAQLEL